MKALQAGVRIYFLTAPDQLDQIHAAQLDSIRGHNKQRRLNKVAVLIIDLCAAASNVELSHRSLICRRSEVPSASSFT
jgi:DNA replication protein DnaC